MMSKASKCILEAVILQNINIFLFPIYNDKHPYGDLSNKMIKGLIIKEDTTYFINSVDIFMIWTTTCIQMGQWD